MQVSASKFAGHREFGGGWMLLAVMLLTGYEQEKDTSTGHYSTSYTPLALLYSLSTSNAPQRHACNLKVLFQ